jgi:hypothetical protein
MVGYTNLKEQVDADFADARRRALLRRMRARLRSDNVSDGSQSDGAAREHPGHGPETSKGEGYESSIPHGVQSAPHHLPVLRIG